MFFNRNRKGGGVILTGSFVVPAAISLAQQGIVSANPDSSVVCTKSMLQKLFWAPYDKAVLLTLGTVFIIGVVFFLFKLAGVSEDKLENASKNGPENNLEEDNSKSKLGDELGGNLESAVPEGLTPTEQKFCKFLKSRKDDKLVFFVKVKNEMVYFQVKTEELKKCLLNVVKKWNGGQTKKSMTFIQVFSSEYFNQGQSICAYVDGENKVYAFSNKEETKEFVEISCPGCVMANEVN